MPNPLKSSFSNDLGLLLARLPLGAFFLLAGYHKVFGEGGVSSFVSQNASHVPSQIPAGWGNAYLHAIPFLEMAIGAWLMVGLLTRISGLVGALMVLSFIVGATGLKSSTFPFHPNVVFLGSLVTLLLCGPGHISLDGVLFSRKRRKGDPV